MTADAENAGPEPTPAVEPEPPTPTREEVTPVQVEGAQSELDLGVLSTGSASVDQALAPLEALAGRQVSDHAEVFEQVLDQLEQTMTEPDAHDAGPRAARDQPTAPAASD